MYVQSVADDVAVSASLYTQLVLVTNYLFLTG